MIKNLDKKITFGFYIRKLRIKNGIGQRELAKKIGVAASYLNDIEKDKRTAPKNDTIKKISKVLKCDLTKLTDQDYQDINELYLKNLIIVFEDQPFETIPFAKVIHKMGTFANWEQMLWHQDGTSRPKSEYLDPFTFEGRKRRTQAEEGIEKMRESVDTLLVINNDKLREMFGNLTLVNAFENADDVLAIAAKGIAEVISVTGQINVDFNDVNTVMKDSGVAIMGSAEAEGENRATKCVESALNSPLLNDNNIDGAKYVLLNITYGSQAVLMDEITDITDYIQEEAGSTADVIWGHGYDESLGDKLCVTIIATGFNTLPHTGLSIKAPKKNKMHLEEDDSLTNLAEPESSILTDKDDIEESIEANSDNETKKFILNDENIEDDIYSSSQTVETTTNQTKLEDDGKVRFLLEEDENEETNVEESNNDSNEAIDSAPSGELKEENLVNENRSMESKEVSDERLERIRKATEKLRSPLGLNEMESEPAYKRRNIDLKDVKYSDEPTSSKYTLWENINDDGEKESGLSDNNSFLHDNVD